MKNVITILLFFLVSFANAQLTLRGTTSPSASTVELQSASGKVIKTKNSDGAGNFDLLLKYNSSYLVKIFKAGYLTKTIEVDTKMPGGYSAGEQFEMSVNLPVDKKDGKELSNPVGKIFWNNNQRWFDFTSAVVVSSSNGNSNTEGLGDKKKYQVLNLAGEAGGVPGGRLTYSFRWKLQDQPDQIRLTWYDLSGPSPRKVGSENLNGNAVSGMFYRESGIKYGIEVSSIVAGEVVATDKIEYTPPVGSTDVVDGTANGRKVLNKGKGPNYDIRQLTGTKSVAKNEINYTIKWEIDDQPDEIEVYWYDKSSPRTLSNRKTLSGNARTFTIQIQAGQRYGVKVTSIVRGKEAGSQEIEYANARQKKDNSLSTKDESIQFRNPSSPITKSQEMKGPQGLGERPRNNGNYNVKEVTGFAGGPSGEVDFTVRWKLNDKPDQIKIYWYEKNNPSANASIMLEGTATSGSIRIQAHVAYGIKIISIVAGKEEATQELTYTGPR